MAGHSNGGPRLGAGRPNVRGEGRARCRALVDDETRWKLLEAAIDKQLREGVTTGFEAIFRHGYGAPPANSTLDVRLGSGDGPVEFRCVFDDGSGFDPSTSPVAPVPGEIPS